MASCPPRNRLIRLRLRQPSPIPRPRWRKRVPVTITGSASDIGGVVGGVEISVDGGTTWHPATGRATWTYQWTPFALGPVTIKSRATDDSGNIESAGPGVTVETVVDIAGPVSPFLSAVSPGVEAVNVSIGAIITATFSQPMDPATIGASTFELRNAAGTLVAATVTYSNATNTASLDPGSVLAYSTRYTVTVKGGSTDPRVKNAAGGAMPADFQWSFTTPAPPERGPGGPILASLRPPTLSVTTTRRFCGPKASTRLPPATVDDQWRDAGRLRRRDPRRDAAHGCAGDDVQQLGDGGRQPDRHAARQATRRAARPHRRRLDAVNAYLLRQHRLGPRRRHRQRDDPVPRHRRPLHAQRRHERRHAVLERGDRARPTPR